MADIQPHSPDPTGSREGQALPDDLRAMRLAGLLYLVVIVCGVSGEAFFRGPLIDLSAPDATAAALATHALSFRLSVLLDVVMALCDVGLAVLLFVTFEPVSRLVALGATAFRLVQAAILGVNLVSLHSAVTLATGPALQGAFASASTRAAQVSMALEAHAMGYDLGLFFFGINCLLMAWLLGHTRGAHRALAALMAAAGVVYLVGSTLHLVAPEVAPKVAAIYAIALVAELAFSAWLLAARTVRAGQR